MIGVTKSPIGSSSFSPFPGYLTGGRRRAGTLTLAIKFN